MADVKARRRGALYRSSHEIAREPTGHGLPLSVRHTTVSVSNPTNRVEIITSDQRRRRWTAADKVRIVETLEPGMTVSFVLAGVALRRTSCSRGADWWPRGR